MTTATEAAAAPDKSTRAKTRKRKLVGVVVSDKMTKTRVVLVERRFSHLKYGKFLTARKKYKAHDENNEFKTGDRVVIVEHRPLSREKRWKIIKLLERAQEA
jgi:small subunit ribosomal protein S17